jgi:GntR family transcriptional regulator
VINLTRRKVTRSNPLPLYYQVEEDMQRRIELGEWPPGHQIPTESQLCDIYGTSRITIRQAVTNLVTNGLVMREPGRGTFVREPAVTAGERGLTSFTEEMRTLGLESGSRLLDFTEEPAPPDIAHRLRIEPGDPIFKLKRLRLGDGTPLGIQVANLVAARFPGLQVSSLGDRSLYDYLRQTYGLHPLEAEETFQVTAAHKQEAALLNCRVGFCCFEVERITHDESGPFEFVTSIMRGDRYRVHLALRALT